MTNQGLPKPSNNTGEELHADETICKLPVAGSCFDELTKETRCVAKPSRLINIDCIIGHVGIRFTVSSTLYWEYLVIVLFP
mmetsp:Transcript_88172/g.172494  ORF Transcript_88172/g.172494 Transcript_88172/m.172494 type:complete len:81 (-) Transcript_88172:147-389(-)